MANDYVRLTCPVCGKEYERRRYDMNRSISKNRPMYCSKTCATTNRYWDHNPTDAERKERKASTMKSWDSEHKERRTNRRLECRELAQAYTDKYKEENPCACGESDLICLVFHHIDPETKKRNISEMACKGMAIELIQEEMDKCRVVCRNCHMKAHRELNWSFGKRAQRG